MGKVKSALQILLSHPRFFHVIFGMGLILRLALLLISGQLQTENYWEYGQIANQLIKGNGYSFPFVNEQLDFLNDSYPSALVPPGYVVFLVPFLLIQNIVFRNFLLFLFQIGLSMLAIRLGFQWISNRWSQPVANLSLLFLCFLPDLVFAPITIGPTVWFHVLVALIFLVFDQPALRFRTWWLLLPGVILVYMRTETLLLWGLLMWQEAVKGKKSTVLVLAFGIGLLLLPWVIRNQSVLGKPIISNNMGLNFYRGNNPGEIGDWPPVWNEEVLNFRNHPTTYESNFDAYSLQLSLHWLSENPGVFIKNIPVKIWRFWVLDLSDARSGSIFNMATWLPCLLLALVGIYYSRPILWKPEWLLFISYTFLMVVFFPQLRYLTMVKFFLVPYAAIAIHHWFFREKKY